MAIVDVAKITSEYDEMKKSFMERGQELLKESFNEFLAKYPYIEKIEWEQYVPYFNDGDACEFGLSEVSIYFNDSNEELNKAFAEALASDEWHTNYIESLDNLGEEGSLSVVRFVDKSYPGARTHWSDKSKYYVSDFFYAGLKDISEDKKIIFSIPNEIFESIFGSHSIVIVTRDEIIVEEYVDHY